MHAEHPHASPSVSETWMPRGEYVSHMLASGIGERVAYEPGEYLYSQGDVDHFFYVLISGKVHVYNLSNEGHESSFHIAGPGSVIGEAAALTHLPRYSAARVLESSELIRLDTLRMEEYVAKDPRFAVGLMVLLSLKQRLAVDRLHQAVFESPTQRVMKFLDQMAQVHASEGAAVKVDLTHEQIGTLTNLSRVTVTRALQRLKKDGRIDVVGRSIVLPSRRATMFN
ncbi:Crp/Fnr family transcriptional regulator [Ramlibacter sp.]|uniref:Crp/Fnr family transcriptional regulator n=1 Tax=Ramlibacter sp. TaxID=1917967 RepID=UPI003D148EC1